MTPIEEILVLVAHGKDLFCSFLSTLADQLSSCNTTILGANRQLPAETKEVTEEPFMLPLVC